MSALDQRAQYESSTTEDAGSALPFFGYLQKVHEQQSRVGRGSPLPVEKNRTESSRTTKGRCVSAESKFRADVEVSSAIYRPFLLNGGGVSWSSTCTMLQFKYSSCSNKP